jgi:UDPglucose 6-dehydrogenase
MKLLIIGHGFVGKAVDYGFSNSDVVKTIIDPKYGNSIDDVVISDYDATFVCVPTPMKSDGSIDSTILDTVMEQINSQSRSRIHRIIIKSTVTPDIINKHAHDGIVYNPEFLREKTALEDFVNPDFHVFGGLNWDTIAVEELYRKYSSCRICPTFHVSYKEASLIKYAINSFLALKVIFFNQLFDVAQESGASFNKIIKALDEEPRIGNSHMRVPGFDSKRGFGGACFPKDTAALIAFTDKMTLLEKAVNINNEYRSQYELDAREQEQNIFFSTDKKDKP